MFIFLFLLMSFSATAETFTVSGAIEEVKGCSPKAMVWLSLDKDHYQERLLLMHTEVPQKGSFTFYVKPGNYQIRVTDEAGCEALQRISVKESLSNLKLKVSKK